LQKQLARKQSDRSDIDLNHPIVAFDLARRDRAVVTQPGVINKEIDLDLVLTEPANQFSDLCFDGKINNANVDVELRVTASQFFAQIIQSLLAPCDKDERSRAVRKLSRELATDSRRRASDERAATIEVHPTTNGHESTRTTNNLLFLVSIGVYSWLMRILVTGGAGFIGSHLVEKLLAAGHDVAILDDFNDFYDPQIKRANISAVAKDVVVHDVDLRDGDKVSNLFRHEKFDAIAHLAARAGVRPSIQQPQLYYDTNVAGTLHLLEAARASGAERFIFASSSAVYGAAKKVPFSEEEHLTQTLSPYAATKIAGEFLCATYSHLYKMRIVALRYFTVYGARQRPDLAIHQFTRKIHAGEPIDQFGDGTTRRDYTYIDDIIQGTMAALKYDGPMFDVFNLGESQTIQLKDLIGAIETALGKKAKINRLPEQPGDMPLTCADISKARKLLGYNPKTKFSEGLPKFIDWFLGRTR
jgi:UDP-glucuronate 4-epimerase